MTDKEDAAMPDKKEEPSDTVAPLRAPRLLAHGDNKMISQGAEGKVWKTTFLERPAIVKQRFKKNYRHPKLDEALTVRRLKAEARSMAKARKLGVCAPLPYHIEVPAATIYMEYIDGESIKQAIRSSTSDSGQKVERISTLMTQVGQGIAALHDGGLVHGDLTTSNLMVRSKDPASEQVVFIDFGLAYNSTNPEDKAVDLYVLERALLSTHSEWPDLFKTVLHAYRSASRQFSATFNRFAEVRLRGRKRTMVG